MSGAYERMRIPRRILAIIGLIGIPIAVIGLCAVVFTQGTA